MWTEKKGVWFMPTFHPSALLRNQSLKRDAWEDWKKVRDRLNGKDNVSPLPSPAHTEKPQEEQMHMDLDL